MSYYYYILRNFCSIIFLTSAYNCSKFIFRNRPIKGPCPVTISVPYQSPFVPPRSLFSLFSSYSPLSLPVSLISDSLLCYYFFFSLDCTRPLSIASSNFVLQFPSRASLSPALPGGVSTRREIYSPGSLGIRDKRCKVNLTSSSARVPIRPLEDSQLFARRSPMSRSECEESAEKRARLRRTGRTAER